MPEYDPQTQSAAFDQVAYFCSAVLAGFTPPLTATSSKPNSIGMLKISGSGTPASNAERPSQWDGGAFPPIRSAGILSFPELQVWHRPWSQAGRMGSCFTASPIHTACTMDKPLTLPSETSYS